MRETARNATIPDVTGLRSSRGGCSPACPPRLTLEDTLDLVRSVSALALFAENHGFVEAELLVRDLLDELALTPRRP